MLDLEGKDFQWQRYYIDPSYMFIIAFKQFQMHSSLCKI